MTEDSFEKAIRKNAKRDVEYFLMIHGLLYQENIHGQIIENLIGNVVGEHKKAIAEEHDRRVECEKEFARQLEFLTKKATEKERDTLKQKLQDTINGYKTTVADMLDAYGIEISRKNRELIGNIEYVLVSRLEEELKG
jgi:flagellar motility protein MotE (MotC chaperone)